MPHRVSSVVMFPSWFPVSRTFGHGWGSLQFTNDLSLYAKKMKLDDGWPESVEEQGLLLLVWRRNIRNDIWKLCYRQSRRGVSRQNSEKCKTIVCIANTFTHRRFYTQSFYTQSFYPQKLLPTEAFTHRSFFYTQKLLHTEAFTHRSFYIQKLLHTDASTQILLHTEAFTHRHFYTQTLLHTGAAFTHKRLYTQKLLHIDAFTHRHLYTQTLLHKHFYTQTLLHAYAFTHRSLYTQSLVHTDAFTHRPAHVLAAKSSLSWPPQQSDGVVRRSPISMWLETSIHEHVMRAMCFGAPQPRWFAISPKRSINGRTWQAATVSGLGHTQFYNMI